MFTRSPHSRDREAERRKEVRQAVLPQVQPFQLLQREAVSLHEVFAAVFLVQLYLPLRATGEESRSSPPSRRRDHPATRGRGRHGTHQHQAVELRRWLAGGADSGVGTVAGGSKTAWWGGRGSTGGQRVDGGDVVSSGGRLREWRTRGWRGVGSAVAAVGGVQRGSASGAAGQGQRCGDRSVGGSQGGGPPVRQPSGRTAGPASGQAPGARSRVGRFAAGHGQQRAVTPRRSPAPGRWAAGR